MYNGGLGRFAELSGSFWFSLHGRFWCPTSLTTGSWSCGLLGPLRDVLRVSGSGWLLTGQLLVYVSYATIFFIAYPLTDNPPCGSDISGERATRRILRKHIYYTSLNPDSPKTRYRFYYSFCVLTFICVTHRDRRLPGSKSTWTPRLSISPRAPRSRTLPPPPRSRCRTSGRHRAPWLRACCPGTCPRPSPDWQQGPSYCMYWRL